MKKEMAYLVISDSAHKSKTSCFGIIESICTIQKYAIFECKTTCFVSIDDG